MHDTIRSARIASVAAIAWVAISTSAFAAEPPPHILYIVAGDLGWKDVGYHGSDIRTPNIDQLAKDGVRLEQFYAQPMCTPTRAAFLTGRYPFRYGLQTAVIPAGESYGLPTDEYLLPQALAAPATGPRSSANGIWATATRSSGRSSAGSPTSTAR